MAPSTVTAKFWGVRGSVPTPGASTQKFGGNTSCVELITGEEPIILDAGTGLRALGTAMLKAPPPAVHILLGHYHWDHMLGLPFFPLIFGGKTTIHVYGERKDGGGPEDALRRQFAAPHFPVDFEFIKGRCRFHDLAVGDSFKIGRTAIKVGRLNHPQLAVAYRATHNGVSLVYATDHEHDGKGDKALVKFSRDADLLVYDAMYTGKSYAQGKQGWGHSTWEEGCRISAEAGVKRLALFHHDPVHDDALMAGIERSARKLFKGALVAREGASLKLSGK